VGDDGTFAALGLGSAVSAATRRSKTGLGGPSTDSKAMVLMPAVGIEPVTD
jgi:hypothetical protein